MRTNRRLLAVGQAQHALKFQFHAVGARLVGLVDHEDVGNLHDAGLDGLDIVAHARHQHDHRDLCQVGDLHFVLSHAYRFDDDVVPSRRPSIRRARSAVARAKPPVVPRVAIDRMKIPGSA